MSITRAGALVTWLNGFSPTVATWLNHGARAFAWLGVLPVVLTELSPAEAAVWYLFMTLLSMRMLVDMGFSTTFTRFAAFAAAGRRDLDENLLATGGFEAHGALGAADQETLGDILATAQKTFRMLTAALLFGYLTVGSLLLVHPISQTHAPRAAWVAWGIFALSTSLVLYGNVYKSVLEGIGELALVRMVEAAAWFGAGLTLIGVLLIAPSLPNLVIGSQGWLLAFVAALAWRVRRHAMLTDAGRASASVFKAAWPRVWRSGVGILMSAGVVQGTGLVYAQFGQPARVTGYLIAINVLRQIGMFSQAPLYSRIPDFSRMRAAGSHTRFRELAVESIRQSQLLFVLTCFAAGVLFHHLMPLFSDSAVWVRPVEWVLLTVGFFAERFGAMHLQLFTTTNRVKWHIANGVTGSIIIAVSWMTVSRFDLLAFPLGMLAGNLGFYSWYCARLSHSALQGSWISFEARSSLLATGLLVVASVAHFALT